jgi:amidase
MGGMTELWQLGAQQLAATIRSREASSREVVEAHLARIDTVNPALNAIVRRVDDDALAAADAADKALASDDEVGPLHGVPFTVKENIDLAGTPTTNGVVILAEALANVDAPVVERMRAAGAIPIGRTNLPDLGLRVHTDSSLHGLTRNPWDPTVTAGGSSGGEAAALASGMSPIGLGNDLGGSLRNPAHCCGIASIKPSTGVVPSATVVPPEDVGIAFQLMAVDGVMARRVDDVAAGLTIIAGAHSRDPESVPAVLAPPPDRPLRVAVCTAPPGGDTHPDVIDGIRGAADALADAGHEVSEDMPASYERSLELWALVLGPDLLAQREVLFAVMGDGARAFLELTEAGFVEMSAAEWSLVFIERRAVARAWERFFADVDVLLTPTWASPPFAHGADIADEAGALSTLETMRPVLPANLLGLPAAVAPAAVINALPVGAQFVSGRFGDRTALAAARALEDAVGVFTPIDPR